MKYYEVWGWDTFAGEDYFCGRYLTRQEAVEALLQKEKEVEKTQDEEIRDTYSITVITENEIEEREKEQNRINIEKTAEASFNVKHLTLHIRELLRLFKNAWEKTDPIDLLRKNEEENKLIQEVTCNNEEDCFSQIGFSTLHSNGWLIVSINVTVRSGKYFHGGRITSNHVFINSRRAMLEWADTKEALDDCTNKIKELIKTFYKD